MIVEKIVTIKIELTVEEALQIIKDFDRLEGDTEDMCITKLMGHLHMLT